MDTVSAFAATENVKVDRYVVSGASKRGWTTWTTAAVDKRVVAIIPLVIDVLNVEAFSQHHWQSYGFWAPSMADYVEWKIMDRMGTPQTRALLAIEDPYSYRDRLTMPKYIVNASGDQFFMPDSSRFYFDDLKGEKHLRYVPNTDHSLRETDALENVQAFYELFLQGTSRPKVTWSLQRDGSLSVKAPGNPTGVKLWQATNPKARDFRLEEIGRAWTGKDLEATKKGEWVARVAKPSAGWTAYFVEVTYAELGKRAFKTTTSVQMTPDTLPFPRYVPRR
jgi:PhoPQ-activated pathogenicity-related protein